MSISASSPRTIFLAFVLWAIVLTFPLALHPFTRVPMGSEKVGTVPFFNLWTLQWNIDQLVRGYPHYWDAPIFAPATGTFAFSETQPLSALLAAPLWLGLQSPALAYNALVILFLTLNGWFACWLVKSWGVSRLPALLTGLLVQSLPFVAQEMGVLQLVAIFGFLWSLFFLNRFLSGSNEHPVAQPAWRSGLALALGVPVTFFTCLYYGLFSLFFLPLAFLFHLRRQHFKLKILGPLLAVGLLALALTAPFLLAQQQRLEVYGFTRSNQTIENNSARLKYYGNFLDYNLLYGQILGRQSGRGQRLFPGFGLILLAVVGLAGQRLKRTKAYLIVAIALALVLSLGLRFDWGGLRPYQWVREYVPGFSQLRSPFRFAALVQVHLALLAGFGLQNLRRRLPTRHTLVASLATTLSLFELLALPLPPVAIPDLQTDVPWQTWLNNQTPAPQVILLPFAQSGRVTDFEQTTRWMLQSRHFQGEMLNGYSGFFPPDYDHLKETMLQFPTAEGIQLLREKGADYAVVYHGLPHAPPPEIIKEYLPLVFQDEREKIAIYRLDR